MNDKIAQDPLYDLKSVKMPYLSGAARRVFAALLENPLGGLLIPGLFRSSGISWLREQRFDEPPARQPIRFPGAPASALAAERVVERKAPQVLYRLLPG